MASEYSNGRTAIVVPKKQRKCWALGRFSHTYTLGSFLQGGFFLRKKPLGSMASEYSNGRTAVAPAVFAFSHRASAAAKAESFLGRFCDTTEVVPCYRACLQSSFYAFLNAYSLHFLLAFQMRLPCPALPWDGPLSEAGTIITCKILARILRLPRKPLSPCPCWT